MAHPIERRSSPRTLLKSGDVVRLELRHRVQLLDISLSGAALACEAPLPVGTRGHIRTELAARPFIAEVAIMRHLGGTAAKDVTLGTQFGAMDDRSRQNLEQFLRRGKD
jgi:hypothetical protein